MLGAMTVDEAKALLALQLLVEGNSIRSTERIAGIDKNTIMRLLVVVGQKCERMMLERIRDVRVEHLELDEVWTYVGCHQKRVRPDMDRPELRGDQYTYIALEERSKLVLAWHLGKRDSASTDIFTDRIRKATKDDRLFDVSTDAFAPYERSIERNLFDRANHSQIVKLFSHHVEQGRERYSPRGS